MALEKIPAAGLEAGSVNATAIAVNSIPSSRLTTTGVVANSYGNSSQIPVVTIDSAGRITNASTTAVAGVTGFSYEGANNTFSITTGDGSTFKANISANSIAALALGSSGVVANVYGNATAIPVITIDEDGRISNATTTSVSGVTGVSYTAANSTLTVSTSISNYTAPLTAGNSSVQGLLKVVDSVSNGSVDVAASANSVKTAYELASNAVSNATSYAATAYSNAVSVAASDATTKAGTAYSNAVSQATTLAGTAYSNAVSTAASDATSKSDTAYSNAVSQATTLAGTAYSNAVSTAASDATTKANTAYSNAVSVAASDATSKANTAYSNAVSQATTLAGTAYSNAVSYAGTIAGTSYSNAVSVAASDATTKAGTAYSNAVTVATSLAGNAYSNAVAYADAKVANLVNSAPAALDTLLELAAALGNDASFSTTVTTGIGNAYTNAVSQATTLAGTAYSNATSYAATIAGTAYSNAVSVAASDATTKAGTAYSNAVSTAASDATTKAGTAYSNAVSTAASDATTKAGTAYSNATSYAATIAGTAYSNATAFAANASNISSGTLSAARLPATYLTAESDTLATVTARGATTSTLVRINNQLQVGQNTNGTAWIDAYGGFAYFGADSNSTGMKINNAGTAQFYLDARAPIFYDSDNTSYYVNPGATTSAIFAGSMGLGSTSPVNSAWGNSTTTSQMTIYGLDYGLINLRGDYSGGAHYSMGAGGGRLYAAYDTNAAVHRLTFYGSFTGFNNITTPLYNIHLAGTGYASDDWRAPIFYDSNNTGYYVDPASGSNLYGTLVNTGGTAMTSGWNRSMMLSASYPVLVWNSGNTTYSGIGVDYSNAPSRFYFWINGTSADVTGTGTIAMSMHSGNYVTATGSFRAPIFYDSDDSGWYVNPASTSRFNYGRFQGPAYAGSSCVYGDERMTLSVGSSGLGSIVYQSTYNDAAYPDYGMVFVHGASGGNRNVWSISPDGPAKGNLLGFLYDLNSTNIHSGTYRFWLDGGGISYSQTSSRAPIFYDRDDTNYYMNPAGGLSANFAGSVNAATYNLAGLLVNASGSTSNGGSIAIQQVTSEGWTGIFADYEPNTGWGLWHDNPNNYFCFTAETSNGGIRSFYVPSRVSGLRLSYEKFRVDQGSGDTITGAISYALSSSRAPIFYDYDDTTYYANMASTSSFNVINSYALAYQGAVSADNIWGMFFDSARPTSYAIYRASGAWVHPYPDLRIAFHTGIQIGANASYGGVRFYNDYDMATEVMSVNYGAVGLGADNVYVNNSLVAGSSLRAPIFYDSNNTAYYLDPASTGDTALRMRGGALFGPNTTWGAYLAVGGNGDWNTAYASVATTNGNLHLDSATGSAMYLNYYMGTNVYFGNGASGGIFAQVANDGSFRSPIYYDYSNTGYYVDPASTSNLYGLTVNQTITGSVSGNAGTAGGLSVHSGRNNEADKIVRTDSSGHIQAGWINTVSGNSGSGTRIDRIYCSSDQYLRYLSLTDFKMQMGLSAKSNHQRYVDYTGDPNYWVGSMGNNGYGANETFHGGSGFFDIWSGTNYPSGTSHIHGFNALHYTTNSLGSTGGNAYGWQMASQYDQNGRFYTRSCTSGVFSSWYEGVRYGYNVAGNLFGNILYDSDNTGYYLDPNASTSLNVAGAILAGGNITAYYSDDRLKTKLGAIENAIDKVKSLNGFYYEANEVAQKLGYKVKREVGLSAQEIQAILPEIVAPAPIDNRYLTIDYQRVVPLLVEAIKEQQSTIERLEALVNSLINKTGE